MNTITESSTSAEKKVSIRQVVIASWIGTSIEWYDFYLYGTAAALVLGPLFFSPKLSPFAAQLAAFATFWVGFAARPVGGIIFGHFGDKIGRKTILMVTLLIMGSATVLVGCLPTYSVIGIWAPILLVVLRFLQGLAIGGEWGGAVLLATEHSPASRRGFYGSWPQMGAPVGLLLSSLVFSWVSTSFSKEAFLAVGWRIPFLLSIVLVGVGLFIRLRIVETPDFEQVKATHTVAKVPLLEVLRTHLKTVLLATGALFLVYGGFYIFVTFILSYGTTVLKLPGSIFLTATLIGAVVMFLTVPLAGALSDRTGRLPVYLAGAVFLGIMTFPIFWLIDSRSPIFIILALSLALFGVGVMYGPQAALFSELFGANIRYSGASLGYQGAGMLAGGLAPSIATWLLHQFGPVSWPIALYLIGMALITIVSTALLRETRVVTKKADLVTA